MESANPYAAPNADLSRADGQYDDTSVFSAKGRLGRLSYLAWSMTVGFAVALVFSVVLGAVGGLDPENAATAAGANIILQLIASAVTIMFVIRRLHDINASGWWALLMLIPVVNMFFGLFLVLKRGSEEANRFGPPRLTRGWERVVGFIGVVFIVLGIIGIVAAILIPAVTN